MYQVLVYIHIVCAMIWVGGAFYTQLLAIRVGRSDDPSDLPKLGRHLAFLGMRVFLPASILLFVAGLIMVVQRYSFGQLWVSVAMALWIVSALTGALYLGPRTERMSALFEAEGPTSSVGRALLARIFLVARLELVSFAVIIALMVFKPGSLAA